MPKVLSDQPVVEYLHRLERAIKQKVGVVPEDVLTDAREHLIKDASSMRASEPGISDEELLEHFLASYGDPEQVAQQYENEAKPVLRESRGYAPNWRICCTKCGRSAPAERVGITRVAARSKHKYILGWCHDCRWPRFMRMQQDLDETNLTDALGVNVTGKQMREGSHKPTTTIVSIIAIVLVVNLVVFWATGLIGAEPTQKDSTFKNLPRGWSVSNLYIAPENQLKSISNKLGWSTLVFIQWCCR